MTNAASNAGLAWFWLKRQPPKAMAAKATRVSAIRPGNTLNLRLIERIFGGGR